MADPTPYDILQDNQISALQDIVTPYYQPPDGAEYSFPVIGQGITSEQFQLISRAAGTGTYVQSDDDYAHNSYRLAGMPGGDSETNSTNKMILRTSGGSGRSESVISGFYHVLQQDLVIDLPPVTTPTTYHICITYDPREEEAPGGPVKIHVYPGAPPTTHGRKHIVLQTVHREPNQLLTDATITHQNPWLGPVINVWNESHLPAPSQVEYGTLAVVIHGGGPNVPVLFTSRGLAGWIRISDGRVGDWRTASTVNGWSGTLLYRMTPMGVQFHGRAYPPNNTYTSARIMQLPAGYRPSQEMNFPLAGNLHSRTPRLLVETDGSVRVDSYQGTGDLFMVDLSGVIVPIM